MLKIAASFRVIDRKGLSGMSPISRPGLPGPGGSMLKLFRRGRLAPAAAVPLLACAFLIAGLQAAEAAAADSAAAPAGGAFEDVEIDLGAGIFKKVLPFDVPFLIHAAVTDDIQAVCAAYFKEPPRSTCPQPDPQAGGPACAGKTSADRQICPAPEKPYTDISRWLRKPGIDSKEFFLLVTPLDPGQRYCFKLVIERRVSPAQLTTFRAQAHAAIDATLRAPQAVEGLSVADARKLRAALIAAVLGPASRDTISAPPGSIFDACAQDQDVQTRFNERLAAALEAQNHRKERLRNYCTYQSRTVAPLQDLTSRVRSLADRLERARAATPAVAQALGPHAQALAPAAFKEFREGDPDCADPGWTGNVWEAAELAPKLQRAGRLKTALDDTSALLEAVDTPSILAAAGVSSSEIAAAADVVASLERDARQAQAELQGASQALAQRNGAIDTFVQELGDTLRSPDILIEGTSVADFATRSAWYVSADLGAAVAPGIDQAFSYIGLNLYFRPVNKQAPLGGLRDFGRTFTRRFSVMLGLTVQGNLTETGRRDNLLGSQMGVVGAGVRVLDSVRLSAGALVFRKFNPNPLITGETLATTPFISVSIDWDVESTVTKLGAGLGIK
jgi:hypothetical protein